MTALVAKHAWLFLIIMMGTNIPSERLSRMTLREMSR